MNSSENLQAGMDFLLHGKPRKAVNAFQEILESNSENEILVSSLFAIALIRENEISKAESALEDLSSERDQCPEYFIALAFLKVDNEDYESGLKKIDKALQLQSNHGMGLYYKGFLNHSLDNYKLAEEFYNQALSVQPGNFYTWLNRGKLYSYFLDDSRRAIHDFTEAIQINSKVSSTWLERGRAKTNNGDKEGALEDYTKAIDIDPKSANAYAFRAHYFWIDIDDKEKALEDYSKSLSLDSSDELIWTNRGKLQRLMGKTKEAIADFNKALAISKDDKDVLENRKLAYVTLGQYDKAFADKARLYQLGKEINKYNPSNDDQEGTNLGQAAQEHMNRVCLPNLRKQAADLVEYYVCYLSWGQDTTQSMHQGTSAYVHRGKYGLGYICFSTKDIQITSLGNISKRYLKNRGLVSKIFLVALRNWDMQSVEKEDRRWSIPLGNIQGILKADEGIRIVTPSESWIVDSYYSNYSTELESLLNMARAGTLAHILDEDNTEVDVYEEDIFAKLEKLGELREKGILTNGEFEEKKRELLSKI